MTANSPFFEFLELPYIVVFADFLLLLLYILLLFAESVAAYIITFDGQCRGHISACTFGASAKNTGHFIRFICRYS